MRSRASACRIPRLKVALRMPPPENASPTRLSLVFALGQSGPKRNLRESSICTSSSLRTFSIVMEAAREVAVVILRLLIRTDSDLIYCSVTEYERNSDKNHRSVQ